MACIDYQRHFNVAADKTRLKRRNAFVQTDCSDSVCLQTQPLCQSYDCPHMDLLRGTASSMHRDCTMSCAASSPAVPTATTTTAAVTAAMAAAAAAATTTAIAAATAPMAAAATATENDDDVFNFCDARTGVHQTGVNLDNLIRVERVNTASHRTRDLQFTLVNPRSVRNKTADISDYVVTNDIDVVLMAETWLTSGDAVKHAELTPGGFNLKDNPRPSGRTGGGVGVLFKTGIQCKVLSSGELNFFEYGNYELLCQKMKVDVHVIYRPPYSEKHRVTTATFFEEFQTYLSHAVQTPHSLLIAGDFNIHMDIDTDADAIRMCDVLSMYNLTQHVTVPTHISGHTLDLIITRYNRNFCLVTPWPITWCRIICLCVTE